MVIKRSPVVIWSDLTEIAVLDDALEAPSPSDDTETAKTVTDRKSFIIGEKLHFISNWVKDSEASSDFR